MRRSFSPRRVNTHFAKLTLYTDDIIATIEHNEFIRRKDAAQYAAREMKKDIGRKGRSEPGEFPGRKTGFLRRKVGYSMDKHDRSAIVGSKSPHAHLLEFGHGDGKERNKRPFIVRSLRKAEPGIIAIMSREYF